MDFLKIVILTAEWTKNSIKSIKNYLKSFKMISATVRLHVAYVGSDYYPLSWIPLNILGSDRIAS